MYFYIIVVYIFKYIPKDKYCKFYLNKFVGVENAL